MGFSTSISAVQLNWFHKAPVFLSAKIIAMVVASCAHLCCESLVLAASDCILHTSSHLSLQCSDASTLVPDLLRSNKVSTDCCTV